MGTHRKRSRSALTLTATAAAIALAFQAPARADAIDNLIDKLKAKGVLSEEEYQEFKDARDGEKAVTRKRKQEEDETRTKSEDRSKTEMVGNFNNGLTWESADKKNSLHLGGRLQLDYRKFGGDDALAADTFDIRRAYLTVDGKFWEYYTFDVTADFASLAGGPIATTTNSTVTGCSGNPVGGLPCTPTVSSTSATSTGTASHLDVAWLNAAWWKGAQFRFGQFKMPYSIEELTSSRFIDFQERSILNQFVPAKERGIMLHGTPIDGVFYGIALSTGQGKNNNETNNNVDSNDIIGRAGVNIAELIGQKGAVYHVAIDYSQGTIPVAAVPSGRTEGRGITFFSSAAFTGADLDRTRAGIEGSVALGPVKLQAEYLAAKYKGTSAATATTTATGFDRGIDIWYASVNWLITGERYADNYRNGAYSRIVPKNNFSPKGGGWGAWELGLRYTDFDASDFKTDNPVGSGVLGGTNKASAYTLGVKWLPTPNTRFLLNYIHTDFDKNITVNSKSTDKEDALTFRAQFDF
jgi:phosphate-selective porin OprO and OprP